MSTQVLSCFNLVDFKTTTEFRWILSGLTMTLQEEKKTFDFSTGSVSTEWCDVSHTSAKFQLSSRPERLEIIAKSLLDAAAKMKALYPDSK